MTAVRSVRLRSGQVLACGAHVTYAKAMAGEHAGIIDRIVSPELVWVRWYMPERKTAPAFTRDLRLIPVHVAADDPGAEASLDR